MTNTINAVIRPDIHSKFKSICALKKLTMSEVIEDLINKWIEENESV